MGNDLMFLVTFIVKFLDPLLFLVSALVVWIGFREGNKVIILYAAVAATLANLIAMNVVSLTPPRPLALVMSFPAALLQSYIVFWIKNRMYQRTLVKGKSEKAESG